MSKIATKRRGRGLLLELETAVRTMRVRGARVDQPVQDVQMALMVPLQQLELVVRTVRMARALLLQQIVEQLQLLRQARTKPNSPPISIRTIRLTPRK